MSSITKGNLSSTDNTLAFPIHPSNKSRNDEFIAPQSTKQYLRQETRNSPQLKNSDTDKYLKSNHFQSTSIPDFITTNSAMNYSKFESSSNGFNNQRQPSQSDIRSDVDFYNKQAYKRALDQQVIEKELNRFEQKKANKISELETMSQYPFGRRTDPNNYLSYDNSRYSQLNSYQPDFKYQAPFYRDETLHRLDKNNIIEKPNSLSADTPPYDPIKHRNGFQEGYNYNPWGRPGGGAPLIDPNTGRKYTKITGQLGYDQIGLSNEERLKLLKTRPLTLEEQKYDMGVEKERKRHENEVYKARAGDVATWITDLESARRVHLSTNNGAHLQITNVTRDKINLESVRRSQNDKALIYHNELGQQMEEKNRQTKLFKLKDDVAGIEHTRKWDDWVCFLNKTIIIYFY